MIIFERHQEFGNDLSASVSNLQIEYQKSKSLTRPSDKRDIWITEGSSLLYVTILPSLIFNSPHDLMWPSVQRAVWLIGLKLLIVSYHFAKFRCQRPCDSSDTTPNIVSKTTWSKDLLTLRKGYPYCISQPANTDSHIHCVNGYMIILLCHVILQYHVIIRSCNFKGGIQLTYSSSSHILWP